MSQVTTQSLLPVAKPNAMTLGKTFVGIDFGTSTTVVSIASYDARENLIHTKAIPLKQMLVDGTLHTSEKMPTVIAWYHDRIFVGKGAADLKFELQRGKNVWYAFKMELGEDRGKTYYNSELTNGKPFRIERPKDAANVFFKYLRYLIEGYCKEYHLSDNISYAVSIPASFEANQRQDLLDALMANGMNVSQQAFIDEPNAAFISYAVSRATEGRPMYVNNDYNSKVMVFDFGGGTCDISILEIGQDYKGFYSKNISISKFMNLGGYDIDRYITYHYLLPRFLKENGKSMNDFRTNEKKHIAERLYRVAEQLKELVNNSLACMTSDFVMPAVKDSDKRTDIKFPIQVKTSKGMLTGREFYLTNKELTDTMKVFTSKWPTKIKGEDTYNTIYAPIESAIKKAHIQKEEIDYVLFIGGSSKIPYIQEALHNYFEDSEMMVPRDLQTHVSQGAAIHSLLYNGMAKNLIQPITSEPVIVITRDVHPKVILPAGTQIPCNTITIDDLATSVEGQKVLEMPLCVGNTSKLLFNLKVEAPSPAGFPINMPVELIIKVDANKTMMVQASCMGKTCRTEALSPFSNQELSTEDRIVLKAERQANNEICKNGGVASVQTLRELANAYIKAGKEFKAAETCEEMKEHYPQSASYNEIGVHYSNSGNTQKAIEFYRKAIEEDPNNAHAYFNLGHSLKGIDKKAYKSNIEKACQIKYNYSIALYELSRIERSEGNETKANELLQRAYDIKLQEWKRNEFQTSDYSWFISMARDLGKNDVALKVEASQPRFGTEDYYNKENLTQTRNNLLTDNN